MFGKILETITGTSKNQMVSNTIQDALERVAEELGCSHKEFYVMIKPFANDFKFRLWIYRIDGNKLVREILLDEILGDKKEE